MLPLLNACVLHLRQQVVEDADLVDAGIVFGAGFGPFRGGPMRYIRSRGQAGKTLRGIRAALR